MIEAVHFPESSSAAVFSQKHSCAEGDEGIANDISSRQANSNADSVGGS